MALERRLERMRGVAARRQAGLTVVLEDIHDPHNAQAVFRTCDAFGVQEVHIIFERESPFDPRAMGKATSSSANQWLDFHVYHSRDACLDGLKDQGYTLAATVAGEGAAESLFTANLHCKKLAVMFGNEYFGLDPAAVARADRRVTIPMRGMVQSLNLSVTAALFLYEATRQRMAEGMEARQVSPEQAETLYQAFRKRADRRRLERRGKLPRAPRGRRRKGC